MVKTISCSQNYFPGHHFSSLEHIEQLSNTVAGLTEVCYWCKKMLKKILASVSPHNKAFKISSTIYDLLNSCDAEFQRLTINHGKEGM